MEQFFDCAVFGVPAAYDMGHGICCISHTASAPGPSPPHAQVLPRHVANKLQQGGGGTRNGSGGGSTTTTTATSSNGTAAAAVAGLDLAAVRASVGGALPPATLAAFCTIAEFRHLVVAQPSRRAGAAAGAAAAAGDRAARGGAAGVGPGGGAEAGGRAEAAAGAEGPLRSAGGSGPAAGVGGAGWQAAR